MVPQLAGTHSTALRPLKSPPNGAPGAARVGRNPSSAYPEGAQSGAVVHHPLVRPILTDLGVMPAMERHKEVKRIPGGNE